MTFKRFGGNKTIGMAMEVSQLFPGPPDECERLVGCLQYCAFLNIEEEKLTSDLIASLVGKGALYKAMLDLKDLAPLDQLFYVVQKFSEFGDRLQIVDSEISITHSSPVELVQFTFLRVQRLFEELIFW